MRLSSLGVLVLAAGLSGCNDAGYEAVSIRPTYGWIDGCTDVKISGHGFGDEISATIGGSDVLDLTRPEGEGVDGEPEELFFFFARTPAGSAVGEAPVTVTSDGESSTFPDPALSEEARGAFYYVACPGAPLIESPAPGAPVEGVSSGDTVSLAGCGFDADTMEVRVQDPTLLLGEDPVHADLVSDCLTAYTSFAAPDLADGSYDVILVEAGSCAADDPVTDCNVVHPATGYPCTPDSATTCNPNLILTYGGAE